MSLPAQPEGFAVPESRGDDDEPERAKGVVLRLGEEALGFDSGPDTPRVGRGLWLEGYGRGGFTRGYERPEATGIAHTK
jgi:hypothetical protein